jgi:hypothetical protein
MGARFWVTLIFYPIQIMAPTRNSMGYSIELPQGRSACDSRRRFCSTRT